MKVSTNCLLSVCIASLAFAGAVSAQEKISVRAVAKDAAEPEAKPAAPAVLPVQDHSKGFEMFYKFGLPDVSKAKYVRLEAHGPSFYSGRGMDGLYDLKLQGNAWLVQENKASNSVLVVELSRLENVWDTKVLQKLQEEARKKKEAEDKAKGVKPTALRYQAYYQEDKRIGGKWTEADAAKDAQAIITYLEKMREKPGENDWQLRSGGYGKLFLMAVHFYKAGLKDQANQIVGLLFDYSQDRRKVIIGALNEIAGTQLKVVHDSFFQSGDWAAYGKDLDVLLARYTAGWEQAPMIKILSAKVKARAAQGKVPELAGAGLTDEDKALAAELAAPRDESAEQDMQSYGMYNYSGRYGAGGLWILDSGKSKPGAAGDKTKEPAIARIVKRGIKSVPLLLALLDDEYLLQQDSSQGGYSSHSYSDSDDAMTAERVQEMYRQMRRPLSRGDIAESLLNGLAISESESRRHRGDAERSELKEQVQQWYDENKDKKPVELARVYFEKGDDSQKSTALNWLLKHGEESDTQAIEKHFIESERALQDTWTVRNYVMERGGKAKDFVDKYEQALKKQMEADKDGMFKNDKSKKAMEASIKSLRELLTTRSAGDILADLLSGKVKMSKTGEALSRSLAKEKPDQIVTMMLESAGKATNVVLAADLITYAGQARYMRYRNSQYGGMSDGEEDPGETKMDPSKHAALWKKFLDDNRAVRGSTVSEIAAGTIEALYTVSGEYSDTDAEAYKLGNRLKAIIRARALARLEGKEGDALPEYPSSDNDSSDALKKLTSKITGAKAEELPAVLKGLTLDELLALSAEAEENEELSKKVFPAIRTLESVTIKADKADAFRGLEAAKGKPVDKQLVETIVELCKKSAQEGRGLSVMLTREACLGGLTLKVSDWSGVSGGADVYEMMGRRSRRAVQPKAVVNAQVSAAETHVSTTWELDGPKTEVKTAAKPSKEDDLLADVLEDLDAEMETKGEESKVIFWKGVEEFCAGTGNAFNSSWISVTATPKVDPKEKKEGVVEEEEEEEEEFGLPGMGMDVMF